MYWIREFADLNRRNVTVLLGFYVLVVASRSPATGADFAWVPFDCNKDNFVDLYDAIDSLGYQFLSDEYDLCFSICDVDEDGLLTITDSILLMSYVILHTPILPTPFVVSDTRELCDGYDNDCDRVVDEGCVDGPAASVSLEWDPVTRSAEGNLTFVRGYRVYAGERPGSYLWARRTDSQSRYTFDNLKPGVRYYFAVTAYDSRGIESDFSAEVTTLAR
jgi:hypothetical protein